MKNPSEKGRYTSDPSAVPKPGVLDHLMVIGQWTAVAVGVIVLINVLLDWSRISLPGASPELFYGTLALGAVATLLLCPPLFRRIPYKIKGIPFVALLCFFFVADWETTVAVDAYARTPAGAAEAVENAKERKVADAANADRAQTEKLLAEGAANEKQLADYRAKAEACFTSWGHRLPALEDPVRESLQNPHAFEHVKTELTDLDSSNNNVTMTFRAENGFGAIRTATVSAQLVADDCSIKNIGTPDVG